MKRKLIALLCALLLTACATAESVPPAPAPEASAAAQSGGSISFTLNDTPLTLDFDPDPQFSVCRDGYIQSSFYAYGEGDLLYELYVTFPQDVRPGETITPESCMLSADMFSGVYLYISDETTDVCSAATQYLTGAYPQGSGYSITFTTASAEGTAASFAGTLEANLVEVDANFLPTGKINALSGSFSFSMDLSGSAVPPDEGRAAPEVTQPPASEAPSRPDQTPDEAPAQPAPTPENNAGQRPPAPPAKLITPADAKKI